MTNTPTITLASAADIARERADFQQEVSALEARFAAVQNELETNYRADNEALHAERIRLESRIKASQGVFARLDVLFVEAQQREALAAYRLSLADLAQIATRASEADAKLAKLLKQVKAAEESYNATLEAVNHQEFVVRGARTAAAALGVDDTLLTEAENTLPGSLRPTTAARDLAQTIRLNVR